MKQFTIITINRNNALGLENTIKSVICQTFCDYEYLIIDGESSDGSVDVIKKYEDNVSYWVSEKDSGIYSAMNKAICIAKGKYYLFLNSGDVFYSNTVLEETRTFVSQNYDLLIGREAIGEKAPSPFVEKTITLMSIFKTPLPHQATFIRGELFRDCLYDESYSIVADWKFWIQKIIIDNCSYKYIDVVVDRFDTSGISLHSNGKGTEECDRMYRELLYPRCIDDYRKYNHLDDEWVELGHKLFYTYRLKKYIYKVLQILIKIFKL
ncbi:MAG: glycosyltransferase family 2 protein [Prevotella sp.]